MTSPASTPALPATTLPTPTITPGIQLVGDLVAYVPGLRTAYDAHVVCQGRVQPHVFFWDVVQATVQSYVADADHDADHKGDSHERADWRRTLDFLEAQSRRGVAGVDEVIVTSFLGDLPHPHEPGHALVRRLGPVLAARFGRLRPGG
ncbi:hypothetical protein SLA_4872 [Streptomyces laurentii]|uniref:Uncharacterized protein n=1 Tax=Streptomyces laurentii TaxID=39478 RepID=A0A160P499_STRLU|nr:hypothetical protein SLA_4872 [Streptomyces laurentii]